MIPQKIELNVPANLHYSALVRNMSAEIFSYVGFSKEWSQRLKLVVDELFMNAIKYGSREDESVIQIRYFYSDESMEFYIEDDGTGVSKMSVEQLKERITINASDKDITKTSGRGLAMITSLWTDKLEVSESSIGGIKITFTKKLETAPPPPPPMIQAVVDMAATPAPAPAKAPAAAQAEAVATGPVTTMNLAGEIDQVNIDKIALPVDEKIQAMPEGGQLVLNFKDIEYINSTFIGHIADWRNTLEKKKGKLTLKSVNEPTRDVLDLVGLGAVLNFEA